MSDRYVPAGEVRLPRLADQGSGPSQGAGKGSAHGNALRRGVPPARFRVRPLAGGPPRSAGAAILAVALTACLVVLLGLPGRSRAAVEVYYPPDKTVVEEDFILIEGYVTDQSVQDLEVTVNENVPTLVYVRDQQFSEEAYLDPGVNVIKVGGRTVRVFYREDNEAPEDYRRAYGHYNLYDGCGECHEISEEGNFTFDGKPGEVCGWCHDEIFGRGGKTEEGEKAASVHGPIRELQCLRCHTPHLSESRNLLVEEVPGCGECHSAVFEGLENDRYVHGPLNLGDCGLCHALHSSPNPSLLKEKPTSLCTQCHSEVAFDPAADHDMMPHTMIPEGQCGRCHSPHSSNNPKMMRQPASRVCYECHAEKRKSFHEEKGFSIYACQRCHDLHRPSAPHLITDSSRSLCLECHEFREDALFSHEFIREGGCFSCHTFHAAALSGDIAGICLGCHGKNPRLAEAHGGIGMETSRCTACHLPHQADKENLLLPYEHTPFRERDCAACHEGDGPLNAESRRELCLECHDEKWPGEDGGVTGTVHPPVREEDCSYCHLDHVSTQPFQLRKPELETCLPCHRDFKKVTVIVPKSAHDFVMNGECHRCHDAHSSPHRALLINSPTDICGDCHGELLGRSGGEGWSVPHAPVAERKCRLCHVPHTARAPSLLKKMMPRPCRPCHTELFSSLDSRDEKLIHRPVAEGKCEACHEVHGSEAAALIDAEKEAILCSACHTPFGRGHHVYAPAEVAARTGMEQRTNPCLMCHLPHASPEKSLLMGVKSRACQGCHQF